MNTHAPDPKPKRPPSQFHACVGLVNIYTGKQERGFCVNAVSMSADLLVSRIWKQCKPPKGTDLRLKLLKVVNVTAQGKPRKKRRKGK